MSETRQTGAVSRRRDLAWCGSVADGTARIIQVSIGAPYDAFAREMSPLMNSGAPLPAVAEAAGRFGVRLA